MASISHRFSQDAIFPAQIEDCKAAIRFLRANPAKYSIDGDHIGVWGESSGGHLAALLGTSGGVNDLEGKVGDNLEVSSRVQCVVDYCGPSDFMKFKDQATWVKVDKPDSPVCRLVGGLLADKRGLVARANPITYVRRDNPPFLIAHGDKDNAVPFNQSELLVDALKRAGVDVTFEVIKGGGHNFGPAQYERLVPIVTAFFDKHLKGAGATQPASEKARN
jgi:acetyl esterase/lipase